MQYITNVRGTRAYDPRTGRIVALALAAGTLLSATAPSHAQPASPSPIKGKAIRLIQETGRAQDVTLDFVAADINDVLKALAVQTHTNIVSGSDVKGSVTVSLAHVSLEEALNMVSRLSGFQYAKVGHAYIVGSPATITTLTSGGAAPAVETAVIGYTYANGDDLSKIVQQVLPNIKITAGKSGGSGGVFVVSGLPSDLDQARQVIRQAETALSKDVADARTEIYDIKYSSADDLQSVLSRLVPDLIVTPGPSQRTLQPFPTTADASGATGTTTSYGGAGTGGTVTAVQANLPTKATTPSLLLSGSDADIARARQILAQVDVRPAQINYEAKVTEVNLTNLKNFGLTYDFSNATATIGEVIPVGKTLSQVPVDYPGQLLKTGTFGRTQLNQLVTVQLNALVKTGDVRLLADPNVSAIDGQTAAVFIGDTVNYISSITQSATGQNITTSSVNAGIKLLVSGKVNNDGYITLNVHPEVSLVTLQTAGLGGAQLPDIQTREVSTTLRVHDGDTIAIAGLINQQDAKNIQKVPILGDLPFFGNLFRNVNRTTSRDEVVIFLKVSIAKDQG